MRIFKVTTSREQPAIYPAPDPDKFFEIIQRWTRGSELKVPGWEGFQFAIPSSDPAKFYHLSSRLLVFDRTVYLQSELGRLLDFAGDVVETQVWGLPEAVYLLNVTAEYNCLDLGRTEFYAAHGTVVGEDTGMGVKTPAFSPKLIGGSSLFRIPQIRQSIFAATDGHGSSDDFYHVYTSEKMSGLDFELVWTE